MRLFVEGSPEEIQEFLKFANFIIERHSNSDNVENIEKKLEEEIEPTKRLKKTK